MKDASLESLNHFQCTLRRAIVDIQSPSEIKARLLQDTSLWEFHDYIASMDLKMIAVAVAANQAISLKRISFT